MFESVYHGVPLVTMPVFCDHDVNAAKAVADGYALRLELETLTTDKLSEYTCAPPTIGQQNSVLRKTALRVGQKAKELLQCCQLRSHACNN